MEDNKDLIKEFYVCPNCGRALYSEKRKYFVCPKCGRALCEESKLADFDDKYCGNCGTEITSAKDEALALAKKSDNSSGKTKDEEKLHNLDGS